MQGVVKFARGDGNVAYREVADPSPGPDEALIRVEACGICGTDLHILHDEYPTAPPVVLGHEMAGTVVAVGAEVDAGRVGQKVTALTYSYTCGVCRHCRAGRINLCPQRKSFGSGVNGAMAPWLVVPAKNLFLLPPSVDTTLGAMTEPVACCVRAIGEYAQPAPGDVLVVSGPGPIGLLCALVAHASGATVVLLGLTADERRLAIGKAIGIPHVLDIRATEPLAYVRALTDGEGADIVVECAGAAASAQACLQLVRTAGKFVQMGLYGSPVPFDLTRVTMREISVAGPFATLPATWERTLALLGSGQLDPRPVLTDILPLDAWAEGFRRAEARDAGKVLLRPS